MIALGNGDESRTDGKLSYGIAWQVRGFFVGKMRGNYG